MTLPSKTEVWVYADLRSERFFNDSLNVLACGKQLAKSISGKVAVVLMGDPGCAETPPLTDCPPCVLLHQAQRKCIHHGAEKILILENKRFAVPRADIHASALAEAVKTHCPLIILVPLSEFGRELAARAARLCNAGLIAECTDIRMEAGEIKAICPSWGGDILAEISYVKKFTTGFATVQPHAYKTGGGNGEEKAEVQRVPIKSIKTPQGLTLLSRTVEAEEHRKLETADLIVVGGAGLGTADNFGMIRDLAACMGAEVGATRPPVLQHWVDSERLIGQTGKTVRPNLLISIATSGAVQYTAGIMESKTIVAVNRDPAAPIFQIADLGIVADAKTFLQIFTTKVKQTVMRRLADALSEKARTPSAKGFGAEIRKLRESHGWSLEALAQSTGRSPEFIKQIENNEESPPVSFLLQLAKALNVNPGAFLRREEKILLRDMRAQEHTKRTQSYNYETLTEGAENDRLRAFLVTIESRQTHKPVAYKHEGEEFIYVLKGHLELTLGGKTRDFKCGESVHFNSDIPHKLKNLSNEMTRLLVVLYTP
ncbi:MAG: FAD-binding protein [Deltaproteobacteria bacterium]|nr:FAD-binding protein [Deltaproteobacteria bacterium]MBW2152746.1 FAD-binding protein [Deltaproteobacteria bacterium]